MRHELPDYHSLAHLALPERADEPQPPFHRLDDAAEPIGDLPVGVPLHLPHRNAPQLLLAQQVQQPPTRLGHGCLETGVGRVAGDAVEGIATGGAVLRRSERRVAANVAAAAFGAGLALAPIGGVAGGDGDQQFPQLVLAVQGGEASLLDFAAEAVEGGQGDVLLVAANLCPFYRPPPWQG